MKEYKEKQRETREKLKGRFFSKGEEIWYITREGKKARYANALGSHMISIGTRLLKVNRAEGRRVNRPWSDK